MSVPFILLAAAGLIVVHLSGAKLTFLEGTPRSVWLSVSGGISVSYVFIHLLPELAKGQEVIRKSVGALLQSLDHHSYLMALGGLIVFYGLERMAKQAHAEHHAKEEQKTPDKKIFWLHIIAFSIYNALIGYLLANNFHAVKTLALFFIAMALHFIVTDFGLRENFKDTYRIVGRWLLSSAILIGTAIGLLVEISEVATSALIAVLAGGVILNVMKEELPEERRSRFAPFLLGALGYAFLLLAF